MFNTYRRQYRRLIRVIQGVAEGDGYSVQFGGAKVVKCNDYGVTEAEKDAWDARTRLAAALVQAAQDRRAISQLHTALDETRDALAAKDEELQQAEDRLHKVAEECRAKEEKNLALARERSDLIAELEAERARREQARPAEGGTLRGALDASGRPKSERGWGPYSAAGLGLASIGYPALDDTTYADLAAAAYPDEEEE